MFEKSIKLIINTRLRDIERITAMKSLFELVVDQDELELALQKVLLLIIKNDEDDLLVRNHAAIELELYKLNEIDLKLLEIVSNVNEDIDLRVNVLSAIEHIESDELKSVLKRISKDDELFELI